MPTKKRHTHILFHSLSPFLHIPVTPESKKIYVSGVPAWLDQVQSLFGFTPSFMAPRGQNNSKFSNFLELIPILSLCITVWKVKPDDEYDFAAQYSQISNFIRPTLYSKFLRFSVVPVDACRADTVRLPVRQISA